VLVACCTVGAATGFGALQTPKYEASIELLVGQGNAIAKNPADVLGLQQATPTVAETISNRSVAEAVIERLNLRMSPRELLDNLSVQQIPSTQLIEVSYRSDDPESAQKVVNTIGEVFPQRLSELQDGDAITALMVQDASLPRDPVSPNIVRNGALALLLGTLLGAALALLLEYKGDPSHVNLGTNRKVLADAKGPRPQHDNGVS
jgi:non-specific protein-tyrosine kinase